MDIDNQYLCRVTPALNNNTVELRKSYKKNDHYAILKIVMSNIPGSN